MPAFADMLTRPQIVAVANYVLSLSGKDHDAALAAEGAAIYAEPSNCVSCHGEGGVGDRVARRAAAQRRDLRSRPATSTRSSPRSPARSTASCRRGPAG